MAQGYATTHPGQVMYFMADDYANTSCSTLSSWATVNGMSDADAFFSDSEIDMDDYGQPGMPKVIVVGCSEHKVYYNENYTANEIGKAIDEALLECNAVNTSVNEMEKSRFNLRLSPNPVKSQVNISYEMHEAAELNIDIVNMVGQTVLAISNSVQNVGQNEFKVNTSSLKEGFYFLRIQSKKGSEVVKFSIVH